MGHPYRILPESKAGNNSDVSKAFFNYLSYQPKLPSMMCAKEIVKRREYYPQAVAHYQQKWSKGLKQFITIWTVYQDDELDPFLACKKIIATGSTEDIAWMEALKVVQKTK